MKANTVFAVTMGKMSKIDTNSAAIAANAEEIAEVREIAEGATAGAPIPKSLASEMVEGGVYLYTGSETGYTAGHVYYYVGGVLTDGGQYGGIAIDDTLTSPTMAAPASEVGQIKEDLSDLSGLSEDVKQALLDCFSHVAWTDEHGQDYYDALENALYPPADLVSISAVYTQSGTVYTTDSLDTLKPDLVVTAHYSDNTSGIVTGYTLSGTLTAGVSTVAVSYGGKTATISVTCTVKGWLYRFNQSLLSSGSEDFGLVGNAVYAAGRNGTDYAYSHIIPTSGTASSDTQLGLKATNISRFPDFDGDFTISYWFATQVQMYQHPFYFTGTVSDDPTQYSVSNIVVTSGWTAVNEKSSKGVAGIGIQGSTSALFLRITCTDTIYGSRIKLTAPNGFDSTQWHHYAITRQGTTVRMFIDGALIVSATLVMSTIYKSNQLALVSLFNSSGNTDDIQQIGNGGKMQDFYVAEFCKWREGFDPSAISY